jgi:hypothetical protein
VSTPGNVPGSYREPAIGWMTGFLLAVSFVGLLTLLPLRKVLSLPRSSLLSDLSMPDLFERLLTV